MTLYISIFRKGVKQGRLKKAFMSELDKIFNDSSIAVLDETEEYVLDSISLPSGKLRITAYKDAKLTDYKGEEPTSFDIKQYNCLQKPIEYSFALSPEEFQPSGTWVPCRMRETDLTIDSSLFFRSAISRTIFPQM